jgi:hypothetical protein
MSYEVLDLEKLAFGPNADPCTKLWALVFLVAIADQATEVRYEPWRKKGTLRYTVQGKTFEMVPPPSHLALSLVKTIHQFNHLETKETWRVRFARALRRLADRLDPPPYYHPFEFTLNLQIGAPVSVKTNPSGDVDTWIGVVLRFCPEEQSAKEARAILDKIHAALGWLENLEDS